MKICFDTSALVAALLQQHPQHSTAFPILDRVQKGKDEGFLTCHAVAELFATLSALPLRPKLLPVECEKIIQDSVFKPCRVIPLRAKDYKEALRLTVVGNHSSGAIYDALHIVGARAQGCDRFYTLNLRHFQALAPGDKLICSV